jgi:hypothetical protein
MEGAHIEDLRGPLSRSLVGRKAKLRGGNEAERVRLLVGDLCEIEIG